MKTNKPEAFSRLSLIGSASTIIQLGQAQLYPQLLRSTKNLSWQSGDALSGLGSFASAVASIATGYVENATSDVKSQNNNSILITVEGGDQTGYRVIINAVSDSSSEVIVEMYYEGYNMPMPDKWQAESYCRRRVDLLESQHCPKRRAAEEISRIKSERAAEEQREYEKRENEKRDKEKEREEIIRIQSERATTGVCLLCGRQLNFFSKLAGKKKHAECIRFRK